VALVDAWLRSVLWDNTLPFAGDEAASPRQTSFEIHRLKGILALDDGSFQVVQGVRDIFEIRAAEERRRDLDPASELGHCKMVLIGRSLGTSADPWQQSFERFLAQSSSSNDIV
jgi:G3E family GTPase